MEPQRGQATVEWVGLVLLVSVVLTGLVAAGARVPGTALARAVGEKILCAASMASSCLDEPSLIAAYGSEVGGLARRKMPSLAFERGSRALPVDFRRCRETECADGEEKGLVLRSDAGNPVMAFVRAVDCRPGVLSRPLREGADCSGERAGYLYLQYWLYYADSATLRGVPIAGERGFHRDDWESVQIRIGPDGEVHQRASSHHGFNHTKGIANWGSDVGIAALRGAAELLGARPRGGWGGETGWLHVSGGSHAGNAKDGPRLIDRATPGARVRLVPLERLLAEGRGRPGFAVSPPWRKRVWRDPEAQGTE